ncbi:hypothetical protein [Nocardioides baculatus]|uniref:hypothetical protein n=1 Tax=Nocardioides baculatus TaxID=2801337 RepID=UPI0027DC47F7|nr:hypothetical protein [Nocardioides baculatus]
MSSDPGAGGAELTPAVAPEDEPQGLADRVAAAALSVPGVHDLHGGVLGEVATYLPGRRVAGVRLLDGVTQVHLVLEWDAPMSATIDEVRSRVAAIVPGVVHLAVEDVAGPAAVAGD